MGPNRRSSANLRDTRRWSEHRFLASVRPHEQLLTVGLDRGEVTDKGSINQRAVLSQRAALVEALYEGSQADPFLILPHKA